MRRRKETIARHRREQTEDLLATVRRTAVPIVEKPHPADPSSIELELNHTSNRRIKKMQEVSILAVARCHQQRRRVLEAMEKDVKDLLIADYKDTFRTSLSELEQIAFAIGAEVINYDDKKDFWQTVLETPDVFFN